MRVKHTGYSVPGWGVGDLWTSDVSVLAHEFRFGDVREATRARVGGDGAPSPTDSTRRRGARLRAGDELRAAPEQGAQGPPTGTVPGDSARMGHDSVSASRQTAAQLLDPSELVERFAAFLAGARVELGDVPLDLAGWTPFQVAVARSLRSIPRGEVVGYAELAALAGYPGAQRAVGTFCARNRFAFLLPCHRVVGAGGIGGYGSAGVAVKRRLLALEGVAL